MVGSDSGTSLVTDLLMLLANTGICQTGGESWLLCP